MHSASLILIKQAFSTRRRTRSTMVNGGASGGTSVGRGYAEAFCLVADGGVMFPNATAIYGSTWMETKGASLDTIKNLVLTEEEANQDYALFVDSLEKNACYVVDASARSTGDKFFTRSTKLCGDGFDKATVCVLATGKVYFECPNPSILAISTGANYNAVPMQGDVITVGFRDDWDNVGRAQGSAGAQLNLADCSSYGGTRFESGCGSTTYNLFHEPVLSLGVGLFETEPCGTYESVDCKVGDAETKPEALDHCTWVDKVPTKAPTEESEVVSSNTDTVGAGANPSPDVDVVSNNPVEPVPGETPVSTPTATESGESGSADQAEGSSLVPPSDDTPSASIGYKKKYLNIDEVVVVFALSLSIVLLLV